MNLVSGYILAGGKSSRMGTDKALVRLADKPLIEHAVTKLGRVCCGVHILSSQRELEGYAPLVADLHPGCGPLGGIEAALAHSPHDWLLLYPVDIPFVPTVFLEFWVQSVVCGRARVALFTVFGTPQPTLLLVHREVAPYISKAMARGDFKLYPILVSAVQDIAAGEDLPLAQVFRELRVDEHFEFLGGLIPPGSVQPWQPLTAAQRDAKAIWFANLNTPEDLVEAEKHLDLLDT